MATKPVIELEKIDRVGEYKRAVKETTIEEVNISDIPDGVYI